MMFTIRSTLHISGDVRITKLLKEKKLLYQSNNWKKQYTITQYRPTIHEPIQLLLNANI